MMYIGNLSSKKSVGVKCKEGSGLKGTGIFVILGWFRKQLSRKKVLINHFLKSLQKQAYADVLQNRFFRNFPIFTGKHLCWSLFLIKLQAYFNTCFLVNIAKFFDSKPPVASVDLLFLIKSNVGWFLLKRVDLVIVRVIYTLLVENALY